MLRGKQCPGNCFVEQVRSQGQYHCEDDDDRSVDVCEEVVMNTGEGGGDDVTTKDTIDSYEDQNKCTLPMGFVVVNMVISKVHEHAFKSYIAYRVNVLARLGKSEK